MRRTQTWAAWLSALALAATLGMAPQQGAAAPIKWKVDPAESGDPDGPDGRQNRYIQPDVETDVLATIPLLGNWMVVRLPATIRSSFLTRLKGLHGQQPRSGNSAR
jgi:hypothetical protein